MSPQTVQVPVAEITERALAGVCASSRRGAWLAHWSLVPEDFYELRYRKVFESSVKPEIEAAEAAADVQTWLEAVSAGEVSVDASARSVLLARGIPREEARLAAISELSGVPVDELRRWVDERPTHADTTGRLAREVAEASRRRKLMSLCSLLHRAAGEADEHELRSQTRAMFNWLRLDLAHQNVEGDHAT